ncbi:SusC/RagA family TonB-linked outer membrane protein [Rhodohalobacter sp. 614A]|uniref:SusC/RagA family TonB-linked outer membrane protein n=1 Tax=Rhodohalobacter sp. 614A TaxID=2908649 RepID=UPI001F2A3508|nr:TonB-dependent receptor [Rhodohalobacter sp. 614A]
MSTHIFVDSRKRFHKLGWGLLFGSLVFLISFNLVLGQTKKAYLQGENVFAQMVTSQQKADDSLLSIQFSNTSLQDALETLAQKVNVGFSYNPDIMPEKQITLKMTGVPAHEILYKLLEGTGLEPVLPPTKDVIVIRQKEPVNSKENFVQTITGTVTDGQTGEALPGANVAIQGTTQGSSTDIDGNFIIEGVEPGSYNLTASFIGYETGIKAIEVTDAQEDLVVDFALDQSDMALDELVVVGYGQQERSDITGSITSVSGESIQNMQTENVAEALQGQAAGALITQSSGEPGSGMDVMIRGASTLGNTEPLYVIDGIPTEGNLASVNVQDVESIEILKDASATAIYGSRAANGVVMITTKRGEAGDIQVQFNARTGVSNIPNSRRINMMDTEDFYEFSVDAYENAGLAIPTSWQEPYLSENLKQNTDWQDELFRQGAVQNYNLTVSGGNENAIYSFSSGYLDEKGTVINDNFDRVSFRVNSEFYIGEDQKLTIGENLSLSQTKSSGDVTATTFKETYQQAPTVPLRCPDNVGGFCGPTIENSPGFRLNQVGLLYLEESEDITQRLLGTAYVKYNILPNMTYRLNLSTDLAIGESEYFSPLYDMDANVNTERDLDQTRSERRSLIVENTLAYNTTIKNVHEINALAGYTQEKRDYENVSSEANGFPSGNLRTINAATGQTIVYGGATASALRSFLGRVQYSYDDRYRAQFAIRRDGSSRFGSERRWGTFPSASVGWSIHNEAFMEDYEKLSSLTVRGSWGLTGTQTIPDFAAIPTVQPVANYVFGATPARVSGSAILQVGNSTLQWQETEQMDIGLDIGFFDERLTFVVDYFTKNTSNLLLRPPVATTSGFRRGNGAFQNVGEVKNSGLELSANYQKVLGDFSFQIGGNVSTIKNEVVSLGVEEIVTTVSGDLSYGQTITRPGSEIGAFYGYVAEGPFRDQAAVDNHAEQPGAGPGDMAFKDLNNDGVINTDDRKIIGSPFPNFFYGLNLNMNYRNWGLRVQVDGVQGRDIMALRGDNDPRGFNNTTADFLDRWTPENRDGVHPRAHASDPNDNIRSSTYRVKDGSYLAIRNVTLSYDFNTGNFSQLIDMRNLRLYVTSSNLAWITSYDGYNPEIGAGSSDEASLTRSLDSGSYPIATSFEVGINIGF